jgi:hypothetical protein
MLDVHPPHEPARSARDVFIHLATIVVGLLIAIGLEQSVEYVHHRRQVAEAREALREERATNRRAYADYVREFRRQTAALTNNLTVLTFLAAHPGTPQSELPGILVWHARSGQFADSAWKTAQQSNVTALMPQAEVRDLALLYDRIAHADRTFDEVWPAIIQARLYSVSDPDPTHLTPAQVADEIAYTRAALVRHFAMAAALVRLNAVYPDFEPRLTREDLNAAMRLDETERNPALAAAIALTNRRLPADAQLPVPGRGGPAP